MNTKKVMPGFLYVYSIYLLLIVLRSFLSLVSTFFIKFSISDIFLFILYISSLILIYKKTKYSLNLNKIALIVTFFLNVYSLYLASNIISDSPQFAKNSVYLVGLISAIIPIIFLIYWQFSKKVKDLYTDVNFTNTIPSQASVENLNNGIVNQTSTVTNIKSSEPVVTNGSSDFYSLHLATMTTVSLISCFMFILTGWGVFFYTPIALIFSVIYSIIFTKIFNKNKVNVFAIYTTLLTLLFGYITILLNIGIVTDSDHPSYLIPSLLQIPDKSFTSLFSTLVLIGFIYLLLSIPLNITLIIKNVSKKVYAIVPLIGLLLIIIHLAVVWIQFPQLRDKVIEDKQQEEINRQANIERTYEFDWNKISKDTFKNRVYSIFTPPSLDTNNQTADCPYTINMIYQSVAMSGESLNFDCLNDSIKSVGTLPISKNEPISFNILNNNKGFKKGDILAVVVELDNPSMLRVYANGNAAKDCACRMAPYSYDGIKESVHVGTSTIIYEQSVVQMQVTDKKRTIMMLYPINIDNLNKINILISQFSNLPNSTVGLKEVAKFSSTKSVADPEWLNKWRKQPNPFLNEK